MFKIVLNSAIQRMRMNKWSSITWSKKLFLALGLICSTSTFFFWNYLYEQQIYYCSSRNQTTTKPQRVVIHERRHRHNFHGKGIGWICSIQNGRNESGFNMGFNPFSKKKQGLKLTLLWQEFYQTACFSLIKPCASSWMEAPQTWAPRAFLQARKPFGVKACFNQDLRDFHRMHPVEFPGKESKIPKELQQLCASSSFESIPNLNTFMVIPCTIFQGNGGWVKGFTLLETNIFAPANGWLEDEFSFCGPANFQ